MKKQLKWLLVISLLVTTACNSLRTAVFDQYSYQKTTEIKVESSLLIDKATTSFANNKEAIDKLKLDVLKLIEYEKNKPNNEITFALWQIINNSDKNLLAGFLKKWEEKGTLSNAFSTEAKKQIEEAFDLLISYEAQKDKASKDNLLQFINANK